MGKCERIPCRFRIRASSRASPSFYGGEISRICPAMNQRLENVK